MLHGLSRLRWPLLGGAAALLVFTATAVAGSGVGGVFNLGVTNTVDAQTTLSGNPGANSLLRLTSTGTAATIRADAGTDVAINGISNSGTGQFGQSTTGSGLLGLHSGSSGLAAGAEGRTASTAANAVGVLGKTTSASPAVSSVGVKGLNADGIGVFGEADLSILGCTQTDTICPNFLTNEAHVTNSALAGAFYAPQPRGNALVACAGGGCSTSFVDGGIAGQFSAGVGGTAVQGRLPVNGTGFGADFDAGNGIGIRAVGESAAGLFFGDVRVTGDLTKDYVPGSPIRAIPVAYAGDQCRR